MKASLRVISSSTESKHQTNTPLHILSIEYYVDHLGRANQQLMADDAPFVSVIDLLVRLEVGKIDGFHPFVTNLCSGKTSNRSPRTACKEKETRTNRGETD